MSDILIKNMAMPTTCYQCNFCVNVMDGEDLVVICTALEKEIIALVAERQDDCPLIEVPPHGRLIDADVLIERYKPDMNRQIYGGNFIFDIEHMPTIIEA